MRPGDEKAEFLSLCDISNAQPTSLSTSLSVFQAFPDPLCSVCFMMLSWQHEEPLIYLFGTDFLLDSLCIHQHPFIFYTYLSNQVMGGGAYSSWWWARGRVHPGPQSITGPTHTDQQPCKLTPTIHSEESVHPAGLCLPLSSSYVEKSIYQITCYLACGVDSGVNVHHA